MCSNVQHSSCVSALALDVLVSESSSCKHDSSAHGEGHVGMKMWMNRGAGRIKFEYADDAGLMA